MLADDCEWLRARYKSDMKGKSEGRLIIRSEKSSSCYTTEVINKILNEEGHKLFDSRFVQLGHTLQGGTPSPRDRTRAVRLSVRCISFLEQHARKGRSAQGEDTIGSICITGANLKIVPLREMVAGADMKKRRAKDPWWLPLKGMYEFTLIAVLSPTNLFDISTGMVELMSGKRNLANVSAV